MNPFTAIFLRNISCLILLQCLSVNAATILKVQKPSDGNGEYAVAMLNLALSKFNNDYKIEYIENSNNTQTRTFNEVAAGNLDITWTATDQDIENELEPIRICIYKGLLGHRILLIRKGGQAKFDDIKTFDDLKKIKFGQGKTWPDYKILTANGLNVIPTMKYENLFYMLDGDRFDAFPRGVQEPWNELKEHAKLPLEVENRILLVYRMPFYLFTSKKNVGLARNLEKGLDAAITDGSFDKLFYSSPIVESVLKYANLGSRIVFQLDNPTLPKATPLDKPQYWLNIQEFEKHAQP